ncbi:MAG: hypothetical protein WC881_11335 [Elusimicrobiota bacterium]|jgi:hypothetical protein
MTGCNQTVKRLALAVWVAAVPTAPAEAAGLRTKFGEVVVKNLKIGQVYSLNKLINLPLRVINTGEDTVELKVDVIQAATEAVKAGYAPIPDLAWVTLENRQFRLAPNHEAVTDVTISIPNDPKYLGRRFEADIWSRTQTNSGVFGVGMQSRLLIHVNSEPPTGDELKAKYVDKRLANLDFTLFPTAGTADNVAMGREVDLRKDYKVSIKIINPNEKKLTFRIKSMPNWESLLAVPKGYEDAYDPSWLKPATELVEIEGNSIKEIPLLLHIPDDARYRGKAFFFSVSTDILEQEISARVFYRLLVTTPKAASEAGR